MAVLALQKDLELPFGFELEIEKGIPLGSGLGGSAASAVAGIVAAAALVDEPLDRTQLLKYAMQGEAVASGSVHVDNIAPSLFGGLVLTVGIDNPFVKQIPVPESIRCVLVHPHMVLPTREARAILSKIVPLVGRDLAAGQPRGFPRGLLQQRPRADPRVAARRRDRAAAPGADPGLRRRQAGRARRRARSAARSRARARRSSRGPTRPTRKRSVRAWSRRSRATGSRPTAGSRRSTAPARAWWATDAVPEHARSRRTASGLGEAIAQGLAPDGGLYVPTALPRLGLDAFDGAGDLRAVAQRAAAAVRGGRRAWRSSCPDIVDDAFDFPVPLVDVPASPGPAVGARAVPRPDRRVQGFRRALPRRDARAPAAQGSAPPDDPRRDVGRHRRCGRRRVPPAARGSTWSCCTRRGSSRRARRSSLPAGAATCARSRSPARSTTASAWSRTRSSTPTLAPRTAALVGEQHQRRPPAAADGVLRRVEPGTLPARGPQAELHRAVGQPRQRRRLPLGARRSACRSARSCSRPTRT